jgi:hypothetical protein
LDKGVDLYFSDPIKASGLFREKSTRKLIIMNTSIKNIPVIKMQISVYSRIFQIIKMISFKENNAVVLNNKILKRLSRLFSFFDPEANFRSFRIRKKYIIFWTKRKEIK